MYKEYKTHTWHLLVAQSKTSFAQEDCKALIEAFKQVTTDAMQYLGISSIEDFWNTSAFSWHNSFLFTNYHISTIRFGDIIGTTKFYFSQQFINYMFD